ncbi:hypothetical protein [Rhizobium sp. BR 315]|uniref:hypothetical protein n=1 Tax=Rhizobium sp. BR 315 TaxID=3040014 RepID=UPI003D357D0C
MKMGLDMFAYTTTTKPETPVDFEVDNAQRLHYWRKHPNLHGWMERLYRNKGGSDDDFDLVPLELVAEDLDTLESDIKAKALPKTRGLFFGESDGSEMQDDLQFDSRLAANRALVEEELANKVYHCGALDVAAWSQLHDRSMCRRLQT